MQDLYHPGNKKVLELVRQIENPDSAFMRFWREQKYNPAQVLELFRKEGVAEIRSGDLFGTNFLISDPKSERYTSWQRLNSLGGYDGNLPLKGKLSPSKFWFKDHKHGLLLRGQGEEVMQTAFDEIPGNIRFVRTRETGELNFILSQGFRIQSERSESRSITDLYGGGIIGVDHFILYSLTR